MQENRIDFTEESNAIDYLEKAYYFLTLIKQEPTNWKWVILALHGALYGFAICALKGIHDDLVYSGKNSRVESLDGTLRKCQNSQIMSRLIHSRPLVLTKSQKASIEKMTKDLRNPFAHYEPGIWIILTEGLPHILNDVLDVILFLAIKTGTNSHVALKRREIERLIGDCKAALKEIN